MRSLWKIKNIDQSKYFIDENQKEFLAKRDCVILESWIDHNLKVHTGNQEQKFLVTERHIGYKVGEFILTREHAKKLKNIEKRDDSTSESKT